MRGLRNGRVWLVVLAWLMAAWPAAAQEKKPNILVIWGDDIGTWNISHNSGTGRSRPTPA